MKDPLPPTPKALESFFREYYRVVLGTLLRQFRDLDLAEEGSQEAFRVAIEAWPEHGVPRNPGGWLIAAGRFRILDRLRDSRRMQSGLLVDGLVSNLPDFEKEIDEPVPDDQLRLVLLCCHPRLSGELQVALILREVCGLSTEEIAAAFLKSPSTIAQRIVRGKRLLRTLGFPLELPDGNELSPRLNVALKAIYLVFNEGYLSTQDSSAIRNDLINEAIRLCKLLVNLCPQSEVYGLLSLTLLQGARVRGRLDSKGEIILLEDQDRSLWNQSEIDEGLGFLGTALSMGPLGFYGLQAAIVAEHCRSKSVGETDWAQIVVLYERLQAISPSPVTELNLCIAVSRTGNPEVALKRLAPLVDGSGPLGGYAPGQIALAEIALMIGDKALALEKWILAAQLTEQSAVRSLLLKKISAMNVENAILQSTTVRVSSKEESQ